MEGQLKLVNVVLQRMQKTLECTICLDLLQNPYTTKCAHSFCNECLERLFLEAKGATKCPLCNGPVTKRSLTQNPKIVSLVKSVKKIIISIKDDFGFSHTPKKIRDTEMIPPKEHKLTEITNKKRVQRKREQTIPFDAQVNFLIKETMNRDGIEEADQKKNRKVVKSSIKNSQASTINVIKNHDKSVEKVTDWLSKRCETINSQLEVPSISNEIMASETIVDISSQQSTVVFQYSPQKPSDFENTKIESQMCNSKPHNGILINKSVEGIKPLMENLPNASKIIGDSTAVTSILAANNSKRKLNYDKNATKSVAKIRKNIRFASEVKTMLLDNSKNAPVPVKRRTKKSPGWTAIDSTKRELRSQVRTLNITGGEEKLINTCRSEITNPIQTQDSVMVIDDVTQKSFAKTKSFTKPKPIVDSYEVKRKLNTKQKQRSSFNFHSLKSLKKTREKSIFLSTIKEKPSQSSNNGDSYVKPCPKPMVSQVGIEQTTLPLVKPSSKTVVSQIRTDKVAGLPCRNIFASENADKTVALGEHEKQVSFVSHCETDVNNYPNDGLPNIEHEVVETKLGQPSKGLREYSPSVAEFSMSKNVAKKVSKNFTNSRNVTDSKEPKPDSANCCHSIPCHLFKALKMFIMSQECHNDENKVCEPVVGSISHENDEHNSYNGSVPCNSTTPKDKNPPLPVINNVSDGITDIPIDQSESNADVDLALIDSIPSDNVHLCVDMETVVRQDTAEKVTSDKQKHIEFINNPDYPFQASASILQTEIRTPIIVFTEHKKDVYKNCSQLKVHESYRSKGSPKSKKNCTENSSVFAKSDKKLSNVVTYRKRKFQSVTEQDNQKYKRIRAVDSSDSSDQEMPDFTNSNKIDKNKYDLDSEEWRDFERFDENVMKCFNSQTDNIKTNEPKTHFENENSTTSGAKEVQEKSENSFSNPEEDIDDIYSSEDEIPCTEDDAKCTNVNLKIAVDTKKSNDFEKQTSSTQPSTEVTFSQSTERLINHCNESLYRADQLLEKDPKVDYVPAEDIGNVSIASAISTQSAFISTQKKNMMESEVIKLRAEINELEDLKKRNTLVQKPVGINAAQADSIELFSTAPSHSDKENDPDSFLRPETVPSFRENKQKLVVNAKKAISKRNYKNKRMTIVCTGLSGLEVDLAHQFASKICDKNTKVVNTWNPSVSHVIVQTNEEGVTERTLKYLYGVATGAWIVSFEWVKDSLKNGRLLKEDVYEALDCTGVPGPHRGRSLLRHVFDGCQMYLIPPFANLSVMQITDLVSICGGEVVRDTASITDKNGIKIVIVNSSDSNEDVDESKFNGYIGVSYDWLIECIGMASRISLMPYIIGEPTAPQVTKSCIPTALLCETQDVW